MRTNRHLNINDSLMQNKGHIAPGLDNVEKLLTECLKSAIHQKTVDNADADIEFNTFLIKAYHQKIHSIVYPAIEEKIMENEELHNAYNNLCMISFTQMVRLEAEQNKIVNICGEKGISLILLKGAVIRYLYPTPESRSMGDIDIVVKKEDFEGISEILTDCGYKKEVNWTGNVSFIKEPHMKYEVFTDVPGIGDCWGNTVLIEGTKSAYRLNNEYTFLHLLTHLVKHLRYKGAGIRNISDIVLVMEKYDINTSLVGRLIKEKGIVDFFAVLLELMFKYLGLDKAVYEKMKRDCAKGSKKEIKEEYLTGLLKYMLNYGIYGHENHDNAFYVPVEKYRDGLRKRVVNFFRRAFPGIEWMREKYAYLNKFPFLLPFAWIHRYFRKISKGRDAIYEIKEGKRMMAEQRELLDSIGLSD